MARQSRKTKQKNVLQAFVEQQDGFFTAQDIADKIQHEHPSIGIATVYRYLASARKMGSIHSYLCGGKRIYSIKQRQHCHFTCEQCGETVHVHINNLSYLSDEVPGNIGHVQIDIVGICVRCQEENNAKQR